jgi:glutamate-1-semialdehyde 2,1-aminomutase
VVPVSFNQVLQANAATFNRFFHEMLERGIYLAPSAFEAGFVSAMHSDSVIETTINAARDSLRKIYM